MTFTIKDSIIIRPAQKTPKHCLRMSDLDLMVRAIHFPSVHFYRRPSHDSFSNFFEVDILKESLSRVLVLFYPMAGRFGRDENGRIQINCNAEGVLFQEAETICVIDDFDDFTEVSKLKEFVPTVDTTKDISSYPLLMIQVTRFKCRGVSLGVAIHHTLADAVSCSNFMKALAEVTRGVPISIPPSFDSSLLSVGIPTSPKFHHSEYDPSPPVKNANPNPNQNPRSISPAFLKLSLDQISTLKEIANSDYHGSSVKYTRFEIIAAHIWRCMCKARKLSDDQVSKLYIPTDGRSRLNPPLPPGFVGNVLFTTTSIALSGNLISEPLNSTVERIHKALKRMDDEYLKSALAYIKQLPDPTVLKRGDHTFKCPNLNVSNLSAMPVYDVNFGWGGPLFMKSLHVSEGVAQIFPSPSNDGSLILIVNLEIHQIQFFKKFFYEIFVQPKNARSRY